MLEATTSEIEQQSELLDPESFCNWGLKKLAEHIDCSSALWALLHHDGEGEFLAAHNIDREPFLAAYQPVAELDPIPPLLADNPSQAFHSDARTDETIDSRFREWAIDNNLHQSLALGWTHPASKAVNGIALYRSNTMRVFDDQDKAVFEQLAPLLYQGLRRGRELQIKNFLFSQWKARNLVCSITSRGVVIDMEDACIRAMQTTWPSWDGPHLPDELLALLKQPQGAQEYRKGGLLFRILAYGFHYILVVTQLGRIGQLTDRQYQIAALYAQGATTADIAVQLSLKPSTVENHRKNIYAKLRLSSNNELTRRFAITQLIDDSFQKR